MGGETVTRRLGRKHLREDPEEKIPEQLQQLERPHPIVSAKQDPAKIIIQQISKGVD